MPGGGGGNFCGWGKWCGIGLGYCSVVVGVVVVE